MPPLPFSRIRNRAVHFNADADTDGNDRALALEAIGVLDRIVGAQFPVIGTQPWFIPDTPGESYIRLASESDPFIQKVYLPNCLQVGPCHQVADLLPQLRVRDRDDYDEREVTDAEFVELRRVALAR